MNVYVSNYVRIYVAAWCMHMLDYMVILIDFKANLELRINYIRSYIICSHGKVSELFSYVHCHCQCQPTCHLGKFYMNANVDIAYTIIATYLARLVTT